VGAFVRIIASVKTALGSGARPAAANHQETQAPLMVAPAAHSAELISSFAHELEAVGGHFAGAVTAAELSARTIELADQAGALTIAIGAGVSFDTEPLANSLEQRGREVIRCGPAGDDQARRASIERIARADLGIVEADCAIASTGTIAVTATAARPSALTLLPPAALAIVRADRLLPDAAAAIGSLGAQTIANHRVAFITGPSRTADIEKLIVVGVHGPKQLHVILLWPEDV
jgi:L-lactate dehydrogenase complex protein LldG